MHAIYAPHIVSRLREVPPVAVLVRWRHVPGTITDIHAVPAAPGEATRRSSAAPNALRADGRLRKLN
jgi:hypothetical protein